MQLERLWLDVETVVAHATLAVQAAWKPENVVAALQAILDEGRVGLLVVLPQEDRIEAEHGLGIIRRDERVPVFPTTWTGRPLPEAWNKLPRSVSHP